MREGVMEPPGDNRLLGYWLTAPQPWDSTPAARPVIDWEKVRQEMLAGAKKRYVESCETWLEEPDIDRAEAMRSTLSRAEQYWHDLRKAAADRELARFCKEQIRQTQSEL